MIENASLATLFAILAPFVVSLVTRWGWSSQRVQAVCYVVALLFAALAVYLDSGFSWENLTLERLLAYAAAILVLAGALYQFVLKPRPGETPTSLQRLNAWLLDMRLPGQSPSVTSEEVTAARLGGIPPRNPPSV